MSVQDIYLYAPMDGTLHPLIEEPLYEIRYRKWTDKAVSNKPNPQPRFVEGVAAQGVYISGPTAEHLGDDITYYLDMSTFPVKAGTLALWYKPSRPIKKENTWLYGMGWATFQAQVAGGSLIVYATGRHQDFIKGDLIPLAQQWQGRWHLIVATWDGAHVAAYVDGEKVAERDDAQPMETISPLLTIGSLPPGGGRPTPVAYADGVYDDLVILRRPMSQAQVRRLWQRGTSPGFNGFLGSLGTGALVQTKRKAYLRGEKATIRATPFGDATSATLVLTDGDREFPIAEVPADEPSETIFRTELVRPGKYHLQARMYKGNEMVGESTGPLLVVRGRRQPEFPVGLGGELGSSDETLKLYEEIHISHISSNGPSDPVFFKQLDRAFSHGICLFPNFNILEVWGNAYKSLKSPPYFVPDEQGRMRVNRTLGWKFLQTLVFADGSHDEHRTTSSASPFSPIAWDMMCARIKQIMTAAGNHPGLWAVSFQDEVPFRMHTDEQTGKLKIGDYSYYAVEHFKQVTGLDGPVFPPDDPPGTVWPEDHPYLLWARYIGLPGSDFTTVGFEDLYFRLGREVKKYRPDVITTNYSGGEYGKNDNVLDWNYPTIWQPAPEPWGRGSGYLDYVFDRHWARQISRPRKPLWALLGWWSGDMSKEPGWCVADFRLDTEMALAKGVKQLMWFSAGHGPLSGREAGPFSRPDLRRELERWSGFLHEKGAVFARLKKRPYLKTAVLWSKTNRAGHVLKTSDKAEYYLVFAGLRNIGANPDVITDTMIREGCLDDYEALVLCGFDYSSEDLWRAIVDFAESGRKVFVDASSALVPPGAISLGLRWDEDFVDEKSPKHPVLQRCEAVAKWAEHLRPIVLPELSRPDLEVVKSGGAVSPHLLWAGRTPYLFILNTDLERPRSAVIGFKHTGRVAYDLMTGNRLALSPKQGRVTFDVTIQPGGWVAYVLPPDEIEGIAVEASAKNGQMDVRARVVGRTAKPLPAALPLKVEFLDPARNSTSYETFTSTDETGVWSGTFKLGRLTDKAGRWTVRATELLTDKSAQASVAVTW